MVAVIKMLEMISHVNLDRDLKIKILEELTEKYRILLKADVMQEEVD